MLKANSIGGAGRMALYAGVAVAALVSSAVPAFAQDAQVSAECPDQNTDGVCDAPETVTGADGTNTESAGSGGAIVVTGSRIRRDDFSGIEPLTVITANEITQAGFANTTDALQSNAVTAGSAQINNYYAGFVVDGGTGANTLGLRNLGPARTLVLLNGRRLAPAGTRGTLVAADLNVLPTAIVESIEVLKSGASSIYGSDAIAGVVNIITDSKLRGLNVEMQANVPQTGAGVGYRIAGSFGFEADRLNVIGSVEYQMRKRYSRNDSDFPNFACPIGGFLTGRGTAFGSGDTAGFDGSTCFTLDNGGVTINTIGVPTRNASSRVTGAIGRFNRLIPNASVVGGPTPGFSGVDFYSRDTFDPVQEEEDLITPLEKYTGFAQATYDLDILGSAEIYGELLATRRKSSSLLYRQLSLDYLQGSLLVPEIFRAGRFLGPNVTSSGQNVAVRAFIGYGLTTSAQEVDYVRASGGIRGDFFLPDWRYDLYAGKSWTDATYNIESFLTDRLANSLNVVQNTNGSFSCASVASNPNCVAAPPLNADTIGGRLPQAFRDYILADTVGNTKFRETTFAASIDGPLFTLPAGSVQLALGAEYRKSRIDDTPDQNSINGNLLGLTASTATRGSDAVREVFGELFVPLIAEKPFFYNLNLNGSVRYTDYDSYGSDITYKIAGEWQFFRGIGIRGSYGTSFRAPALSEQFLGATSGFIGSGNDPCDNGNFPADPADFSPTDTIIAQNCASIGLDVTTFQQNSGITVFRVGGREAGLAAETSRNWSVGAVLTPELPDAFGDLSLSLDYFDIKVENGVADLAGGTILSRCYADPSFDQTSGFCRFVQRDANNVLRVTSSYVNLSTDIVKGYELNARYARDIFGGRLTLNANVTKYVEQSSRLFRDEALVNSAGTYITPDWVGTFDATYRTGPVTFRYGLDWIDGDHNRTYDFFATDTATGVVDPDLVTFYQENFYLEVDGYVTHSLSAQFDVSDRFEFTFGVRNLLNTAPPQVTAVVTAVANAPLYSGYDYAGRSFFANASFKF